MELTKKEEELIDKQRKKGEAKQKKIAKLEAELIEKKISELERAKYRFDNKQEKDEQTVREYFEKLKAISSDYELVTEELPRKFEATIYGVNENGKEVYHDEDGNSVKSRTIKTLKSKILIHKVRYIGETPEGCSIRIEFATHIANEYRWDEKNHGLKMQIKGSEFDYSEEKKFYKSATTVNKKILEKITSVQGTIDDKEMNENLKENALAELTARFPNAEVCLDNQYYSRSNRAVEFVKVLLVNDITIEISFDQYDGNDIRYSVRNIDTPKGIDLAELATALENLKNEE